MAYIRCGECDKTVSDRTRSCPWCGYPVSLRSELLMQVREGNTRAVRELLRNGADVDARDEHENTVLMIASYLGYEEIVRLLIDASAEVNLTRELGNTALMDASFAGHLRIVRMLVSAGAEINAENQKGTTALLLAEDNRHEDTVEVLNELAPGSAVRRFRAFHTPRIELVLPAQPERTDLCCLQCGGAIGADMQSCSHCHAVIVRRFCSACGKLIPEHTRLCSYCGAAKGEKKRRTTSTEPRRLFVFFESLWLKLLWCFR